jgi:hypothetical protein
MSISGTTIKNRYLERPIVAVDGEGTTIGNKHYYILLADSTGRTLIDQNGIKTEAALDWLLEIPGKPVIVGFAFQYDFEQIIKDLPKRLLLKLQKTNECRWYFDDKVYFIRYFPRKSYTVSIRTDTYKRSVTVWDVFGFYQESFVKALKSWGVGDPETLSRIDAMKAQRDDFANVNLKDIIAYNNDECRLLVDLVSKTRQTFYDCGLALRRWDGAGAAAAALLDKHSVVEHIRPTPPNVSDAVMRAYFGGRILTNRIGHIDGPIHAYDINSAYPSVTAQLPTLNGQWHHQRTYDPSARWSVWHVRWDLPRASLRVLPHRTHRKQIAYLARGEGWYWQPLVAEALDDNPVWYDVLEGWVFTPDSNEKPFAFVNDYYKQRLEYKRQNDRRHIAIKLALNSLYGKTAQGVSWQHKRPRYQSYVWAGLITASTQAQLIRASRLTSPDKIIAWATDGIYTVSELPLPISNTLGEWEHTTYDKMEIYQPGFYRLTKGDHQRIVQRGYRTNELDWDEIARLWRELKDDAIYRFTVRRYLPLGIALQTHRLTEWGTWVEEDRELRLRPSQGRIYYPPNATYGLVFQPDVDTHNPISVAYKPKTNFVEEYEIEHREDEQQPDPVV